MTIRQSLQHPPHAPRPSRPVLLTRLTAQSVLLHTPSFSRLQFLVSRFVELHEDLILRCQPVRCHRLNGRQLHCHAGNSMITQPHRRHQNPRPQAPAVRLTLFQSYTTSKNLPFCTQPTVVCQNHQTFWGSNLPQVRFHTLVVFVIFDCFQVACRETNSIVRRHRFFAPEALTVFIMHVRLRPAARK